MPDGGRNVVKTAHFTFAQICLALIISLLGTTGLTLAQEGTPEASPVAEDQPYDPLTLYDALLSAEFPQQFWPSSAVAVNAVPWRTEDETLEGTVAAVQLVFEEVDWLTIAYAIYPTSADAAAGLERAATASGGLATPVASPTAFDVPYLVLDYGNFKVCLVRVNNVVVDGVGLDVDSAVALAQAGVIHLQSVVGTLTSPAPTPVVQDRVLGSKTPDHLFELLLNAEFDQPGVPSYLQNPQVAAWLDETDTDLIGTAGAATITFTGGDGGIAYLLFPTAMGAQVRVVETVASERAAGRTMDVRSDLEYPALILTDESGVTCVMKVDYALVVGFSPIQEGNVESAAQDAISLATAGANHLVGLSES